jgi:ribosome-associated protein
MKKPSSKKTSTAKPSLLQVIINALEDLKAQNIVTLDVSKLTYVTDTLVIASGSSSRQVRALAQNAVEDAKKNGMPSIGIEGLDGGEWVLADFGDVVLHVMQPETREFYDLENLWQTRENKATAAEAKTDAKKSTAKKPTTKKEVFIAEAEFTTQSDAAKARKSPGKPKAKPASTGSKKPVAKAAPVKAGVRAKTGTKKPAASKTVSEKTTVKKTAAKKVAAPKTVAPKPKLAAPKLTAKKSTKAKPAAKKPAARKSPAK